MLQFSPINTLPTVKEPSLTVTWPAWLVWARIWCRRPVEISTATRLSAMPLQCKWATTWIIVLAKGWRMGVSQNGWKMIQEATECPFFCWILNILSTLHFYAKQWLTFNRFTHAQKALCWLASPLVEKCLWMHSLKKTYRHPIGRIFCRLQHHPFPLPTDCDQSTSKYTQYFELHDIYNWYIYI